MCSWELINKRRNLSSCYSIRMTLGSSIILLLLTSFVALTVETCVDRSCPIGQFYNDTTDSCVSSCLPNYGDWDTGKCMQASAEMRGWLDTNVYEVLISSSVKINESIITINLTATQYFRYRINCNTNCIINDISFHLESPYHYFYLASERSIPLSFLDDQEMFMPTMMGSVELLSANIGDIPLNDYKMTLEVKDGTVVLLSSDIIIHVVEPLPSLPVSVTCVGFNEHKYSALESDGVLTATLVLSRGSLLNSFNVTVIANVTNDISPSATAGEDFIPGQYNVTFRGNTAEATVDIFLQIDDIDEETEYFMLYLYIPSTAYSLGVQHGNIIKAVAIIFRPVPIRLVGTNVHYNGRVEVYYNGEWGRVCGDGWDYVDVTVVCRQLGLGSSSYRTANFGQGTGPIWLSNISCIGSEFSLTDCGYLGMTIGNCTSTNDAGVYCSNSDRRLPIRLANGTNEKEGRVEIYWNNQWSTVCDDLWDDNDATVICKQLGYSRGSARVSAYFGEGSGLILLDNVNCNGRESSMFTCNHKNFGEHDCSHSEDAGVVCYGESSKVRLVGGDSYNDGVVEVYYNGEWGAVCNYGWDQQDAKVVCNQLGFESAIIADFGERPGADIILDNVMCSNNDIVLASCGHYGVGKTVNCRSQHKVAAVKCQGDMRQEKILPTTSVSFSATAAFIPTITGSIATDVYATPMPNTDGGFSRSTVQTTIVYGVNLFTMPGIQRVVYAKSSKVLTATSCCLLLIAMNQGRIQDFLKGGLENLKKGSGVQPQKL